MAAPPLLTLSDITLTFGGNPLLENAELSVLPGDRIGLVGRNGSGKSTLMKIMAGQVAPDGGTRFVPPGKRIAYLEQDPDFSGFASLADFVRAGLPEDEAYRADIGLDAVRLDGDIPAAAASGGERRRAALARLFADEADVWLLDEPTNHLDIEMIEWLENALRQSRAALVLISHDRAFLRALTRATLWVDRGTVRRLEQGFDAFEAWRDKTYEEEDVARHKLGRLIKAESRWAVEGISGRRKRNMGRVRRLQDMRAERAADIRRAGAAKLDLGAAPSSGKRVIEAEHLSKSFDGRVIVRDFSLRVSRGERIALVGPNGAGKTTLLNLLTGVLAPDSGKLTLGTGLKAVTFDQTRAQLDPDVSLWDSLTKDDGIAVSGSSDQVMVRGQPRHVVGYLKDFLFTEAQARSPVRALSGGEKARLLLARILARESNLLILDEPTNDLDVETLDLLQEQIAEFEGTVLLVSHDRDFIDRVATTTLLVPGDGSVTIYAGGYSDMLAQGGRFLTRNGTGTKSSKAATRDTQPDVPAQNTTRTAEAKPRLSYAQERRLNALPAEIERLEAEIAKLQDFLSDPDLYTRSPTKFAKASEGLSTRQAALSAAEEEWLALEEAREAAG